MSTVNKELVLAKLNELRDKYTSSDSKPFIDALETDFLRLVEEKDLKNNPVFISISKEAQKKIDEMYALLLNDRKMPDFERRLVFAQIDNWKFIADHFGLKITDTALDDIEKLIDSKLV